jgi:predicted alpha/beta-fold hydrolase
VYSRRFLRSLKIKALAKIARHPGIADPEVVAGVRTLWDFDNVFTGPVHGFAGAEDYYGRSSSINFLAAIRVPTLLLSARDDPFHPTGLLDEVAAIARGNPVLHTEFVARGGHVGFVEGSTPWRTSSYNERRAVEFAESVLAMSRSAHRY